MLNVAKRNRGQRLADIDRGSAAQVRESSCHRDIGPASAYKMASMDIAALECGAAGNSATARIIDEMLAGARAEGARVSRFLIPADGDDVPDEGALTVAADDAVLEAAMETLSTADHCIIGAGVVALMSDGAFRRLRDGCYLRARWVTLADLEGHEDLRIELRPGQRLEDFRFPMPRRELTSRHRGLTVLTPPPEMPDHEDPFAETSFFLVEEILRIMGFMPAGRILATGLYFPPIEANPLLKQQAFDLGRRLVHGAVAV